MSSNVPIKDANNAVRRVDTFSRTEGADIVETQAVALVDPTTGNPIADLQESIQALNETMLYMLSAMLEKMPRLDATDRAEVKLSINNSELNTAYGGISVNYVGNPGTGVVIHKMLEPTNLSDMGATRLYQQILVT